jgi:hypothetical protein
VELHVGLATFRPITAERVEDHVMHHEWCSVPAATSQAIAATRHAGGRIVAIGTTTVRTLESFARDDGTVDPGETETDLFLVPGSRFRVVDVLVTNFHVPRSSLLVMLAGFMGDGWRTAYEEALARATGFSASVTPCCANGDSAIRNNGLRRRSTDRHPDPDEWGSGDTGVHAGWNPSIRRGVRGDLLTTPAFMPVGTRGAVGARLGGSGGMGAQMVLQHLSPDVASGGRNRGCDGRAGGVPRVGRTDPHGLGGYQIFSLDPTITESEAVFRSTYDGSEVRLSPEEAMRVQQLLGADVAMVLDVLIGLPAPVRPCRLHSSRRCAGPALPGRAHQSRSGALRHRPGRGGPWTSGRSAKETAALWVSTGTASAACRWGRPRRNDNLALEATMPELPDDRSGT